MADRGQLAEQNVLDVQVDEEGAVHHILEGALPPLHSTVVGTVDRVRRKTHPRRGQRNAQRRRG